MRHLALTDIQHPWNIGGAVAVAFATSSVAFADASTIRFDWSGQERPCTPLCGGVIAAQPCQQPQAIVVVADAAADAAPSKRTALAELGEWPSQRHRSF
jgi:hypothetical protein